MGGERRLGDFDATVVDNVDVLFLDGFESNSGWTVSGTATDGQWTRGVPITNCDRGNPTETPDGSSSAFLTDNSNNGGDCNSDVDGGETVLTSPTLDASNPDAVLSYWRWHNNAVGASPGGDPFTVEISANNGGSWVNLETVAGNSSESSGGWVQKQFRWPILLTQPKRAVFDSSLPILVMALWSNRLLIELRSRFNLAIPVNQVTLMATVMLILKT